MHRKPYIVALAAVALMGLSLAGTRAAARDGPGHLTLGECVAGWNTAKLGSGRKLAAATAGNGNAALLFGFSDGSCGLVFPSLATNAAGTGIFVSGFDGDYLWGGPLETAASRRPPSEKLLEARADRQTNVRLNLRRGEVVADFGAKLPIVRFTGVSTDPVCSKLATDNGSLFRLLRSDVDCLTVRIVAWAWSEGEGSIIAGKGEATEVRSILGWHCEEPNRGAPPPAVLACSGNEGDFELEEVRPHLVFD